MLWEKKLPLSPLYTEGWQSESQCFKICPLISGCLDQQNLLLADAEVAMPGYSRHGHCTKWCVSWRRGRLRTVWSAGPVWCQRVSWHCQKYTRGFGSCAFCFNHKAHPSCLCCSAWQQPQNRYEWRVSCLACLVALCRRQVHSPAYSLPLHTCDMHMCSCESHTQQEDHFWPGHGFFSKGSIGYLHQNLQFELAYLWSIWDYSH